MHTIARLPHRFLLISIVLSIGSLACSSSNGNGGSGSGGSSGTGGSRGNGSGGAVGSGGATGTGGGATGGVVGTGGATGTGGTRGGSGGTGSGGTGSGGAASGGATATGGARAGSGGVTGSGGVSSGGAVGSGGSSSGGSGGASSGGSSPGGAVGTGGHAATGGAAGGTGAPVDATGMVADMGMGTNIGNTFDNTTTWETGWGEPMVTQAYINGMASHGIKTVRVPVAWNTYAVNGVIDSTKMDRVKQVVGWIQSAGMYSIVNIHWDGGWIDNDDTDSNPNKFRLTADVKTKFASYWTQIATAFKDVGNKLIFEGLNEEGKFYVNGDTTMAPDYTALNTLNQLFVTTVRSQGGYNATRALLIAGFTTDIDLTCVDAFSVPTDPAGTKSLFLSIHYYTPYTFCGLDTVESWGSPATTWGTTAEKQTLQDLFTKLGNFSSQKKIPVIIGEFSVTLGQNYPRDPASRVLWMESVAQAALSRSMVPVLWDTGSDVNRTDGSLSTAFQTVMNDVKP